MAQATVTFELGPEVVTSVLEIDVDDETTLIGNIGGLIPSGTTARIVGNVNLTSDLIVEGLLTGIDTFTLTGNGFQILVQNGGQLDLQGIEKSGWVPWGQTPVGWQTGDLVVVAPTVTGIFVPSSFTWNGVWPIRPVNSPDVTLPNGQIVKPEVGRLISSITLQNLSRIHFHDGAGVQTLRYLTVMNSGVTGVLAKYPIHFHFNGEASRGSLLEGVVVRNGKNHAFVVHGSHGVTLRDCHAYNTTDDAYWWDLPDFPGHTGNNSNDIIYDHCLAMYVQASVSDNNFRLTAFMMGAGSRNSVKNSVATCVQGTTDASGFHWPERANGNPGGTLWEHQFNVAHNNKTDGIFVWQNDFSPHVIEDFIGYHNGQSQIDHGAYENVYHYRRCVLKGGIEAAFKLHAVNNVILEDIVSDRPLRIMNHRVGGSTFTVVRRCIFSLIWYTEMGSSGVFSSKTRYEERGLTPANFSMTGAIPSSIAEVYEAGVLTHRWTAGVWT